MSSPPPKEKTVKLSLQVRWRLYRACKIICVSEPMGGSILQTYPWGDLCFLYESLSERLNVIYPYAGEKMVGRGGFGGVVSPPGGGMEIGGGCTAAVWRNEFGRLTSAMRAEVEWRRYVDAAPCVSTPSDMACTTSHWCYGHRPLGLDAASALGSHRVVFCT
jgi:hypothetical protein